MPKPERRDSLDCLIAEMTDAYRALVKCDLCWEETQGQHIAAARESLERAFQLISDLQAARA
jgi:hypothetical protein